MSDWLKYRAQISPNQPALIYGKRVWNYGELDAWVNEICNALLTLGLDASQIIGVLLPNQPLYIAMIHALARLGISMLPMNTRLTGEEMRWQLANCDYSWLIHNDEMNIISETASEKQRINLDTLNYGNAETPKIPYLERSAMQGVFYTSGTTGKPKGAVLTFDNYYQSAMASAYRLGLENNDRWLLTMPLYHIGGQSIVFRACLYGIAVVLQDGFDADAVYHSITEDGVTLISVVPTMLHRLLPLFREKGVAPGLRIVLVGGAKTALPLIEDALEVGLPIALTYGLTEATSQVATATPSEVRAKPGSVGKALFGTEVNILDDAGNSLGAGKIGEIVVHGQTVMQAYYNNAEATQNALRGGKLYTGDLGYKDDDGDLWIVTRRNDLIISGGENVYPAEVETILLTHPAVDEACVVGLDDAEWGQVVVAAIVCKKPIQKDALMAYCRQRLAGYKTPRQVHFLDSLPKTASGKIMRRAVVDEFLSQKTETEHA